ncbi:bile acid:sodium symporter family protein [Rhizosaccharibacter radicis]|uniref:Bile acid:sodium symporter family protein n=1 Tax=Rhizosaccharibacter radicis TaxID=2782605 RepID=A0ABT1VT80_9PROT|nr:bile acid:sodium symporter family protein [Acetobacteraceae bacterium KSS12]
MPQPFLPPAARPDAGPRHLPLAVRLFPLWALLAGVAAFLVPSPFTRIGPAVPVLLAFIMFAMGVSLTPADFGRVFRRPAPVLAGLVLHYGIMPFAAWGIARLLSLPPAVAAGLILTGSVSSGTASTVMVLVAGGDVALSVAIGAASTLAGLVLTPLLARSLMDAGIALDGAALLRGLVSIVALPVLGGLLVNRFASGAVRQLEPLLAPASLGAILLVIAVVVAGGRNGLRDAGPVLLAAVALHNGVGLLGGYWGGRLLGFPREICRTLAFEVGMQNSGLAATLATLSIGPAAALPGALFSVWHNLSGSLLAGWWSRDR